jgi:hypothetical protein
LREDSIARFFTSNQIDILRSSAGFLSKTNSVNARYGVEWKGEFWKEWSICERKTGLIVFRHSIKLDWRDISSRTR